MGVTKFCVRPAHLRNQKTIVGGTKKFHFDRIKELDPNIIIANKEENYKEGIEKLKLDYPVWTSNVNNLSDALEMIRVFGKIFQTESTANSIVYQIENGFDQLKNKCSGNVLYFIWMKPYMVAGGNNFINSMLEHLGFNNLLKSTPRYPVLEDDDLRNFDPDKVFLSSEPYPFDEKHLAKFRKLFPKSSISLVDGALFSWYGSRLIKSADYFKRLALQHP